MRCVAVSEVDDESYRDSRVAFFSLAGAFSFC